jgi:lipopolysaccharide export system protein LptC
MTYKHITLISIILLLFSMITWMTYSAYHPQPQTVENTSYLPDSWMEGVVALIMDKQGNPSIKIITPKMIHSTQNDTTHLISPKLIIYRQSINPWYVTARFAKASQGIDIVTFWDEVIIQHAADKQNPETLIKTPRLTVKPHQQLADTSDLITLIQPNLIVEATGMHANMKSGDINLLSQAKGEYAPHA